MLLLLLLLLLLLARARNGIKPAFSLIDSEHTCDHASVLTHDHVATSSPFYCATPQDPSPV